VANLGYIQIIRRCNHHCRFCSNPRTGDIKPIEEVRELLRDLAARHYAGVILTGGEPTLHPELRRICAYAREQGLQARLITNGSCGTDPQFMRELARSGLEIVHVSVYSSDPEVEARLRGVRGTLDSVAATLDSAHAAGIATNVNCVINKLNADHLDRTVQDLYRRHPYVRHYVWNNLDPSMGQARASRDLFVARLCDFELSLARALRFLTNRGISFRVEKVPLCFMTDFAWASTETRKIVKGEERLVHFLDEKGTVRQTSWNHAYSEVCTACSLRSICAGLFDRGNGYDPAELHPVFVDKDRIISKISKDSA
jgi:MoaA/NifB/PqqE/SkfB family radical SAM enzyme